MEVKLDKQYPLAVDAERAWTVLRDLRAVAACMPGAEITEQLSDSSYKGAVKLKVGPALAQFGGTVEVLALEPELRRISLRGKGADKTGSSATMELMATIAADPAEPGLSALHGEATVSVNGKFAQFGGRMMVQVADMMLGQFVDNFRAAAAALPAPPAGPGQAETEQTAPAPASQQVRELDGLAIVWMLLRNWWQGLFGRRR